MHSHELDTPKGARTLARGFSSKNKEKQWIEKQEEVQKVFQANLDKVLYFQIIPGTKQEFKDSENIVFVLWGCFRS